MTRSLKDALRGREEEMRAYCEGKEAYKRGHGLERHRQQYAHSQDEWMAFCMGWHMAHYWLDREDKTILQGDGEHEPFN